MTGGHAPLSSSERGVWQVIQAFNQAFAGNNPEEYFKYIDPGITVLTPGNPYRVEGLDDDRLIQIHVSSTGM